MKQRSSSRTKAKSSIKCKSKTWQNRTNILVVFEHVKHFLVNVRPLKNRIRCSRNLFGHQVLELFNLCSLSINYWLFLLFEIICICLWLSLKFWQPLLILIQHYRCIYNAICCFYGVLNHVAVLDPGLGDDSFFLLLELLEQFLLFHFPEMHFL